MKNKAMLAFLILCFASPSCVFAEVLKPIMPRVGIDGRLENAVINAPVAQAPQEKLINISDTKKDNTITQCDLDMKKIADEIAAEMKEDQDQVLGDLRLLWQGAVDKSETIKFAIYKLSNPEGDKVDKNVVQKILSPLTSVAPLVGSTSSSPITGGSAIIGGGILNSVLADDSAINKTLSRVTDADLIILSKDIDDLQQRLVNLYYNYVTSLKILNFSDKMVQNRYLYYQASQKLSKEKIAVADAFYREALDQQYKARQDVLSARSALEQLAGNDALSEVDKNITNSKE